MPDKPNCYDCKHRRGLPGDAHSRCAHPVVGESEDPFAEMMAIFASVGRVAPTQDKRAAQLNVTGNPMGIRRGWFNWPFNFDPTWLVSCDGFEAKQSGK